MCSSAISLSSLVLLAAPQFRDDRNRTKTAKRGENKEENGERRKRKTNRAMCVSYFLGFRCVRALFPAPPASLHSSLLAPFAFGVA